MREILHDIIAKELFEKKSISSLAILIDSGRELEFQFKENEYFISRHNSEKYVSIWCGKKEQSFDSMFDLLENAYLQDDTLLNSWNNIVFDTLF